MFFWKNVDGVVNTPEKKAEAKELIKGYLKRQTFDC